MNPGATCAACGSYVRYEDKNRGAAVDARTGDVFCVDCADRLGPINDRGRPQDN